MPQGDHLGVEVAAEAHRAVLAEYGLLSTWKELRSDRPFYGTNEVQGLLIDDFFSVAVTSPGECDSAAVSSFNAAQDAYCHHGLLGSADKDVVDASSAKVIGGELNSSPEVAREGLVTLGSPAAKRLALAFISLELASLRHTADALHSCLLGGWTRSLLYRRPLMSIPDRAYKFAASFDFDSEASSSSS